VKFAADSSILAKLYLPDQEIAAIENYLTEDRKVLSVSALARTEVVNVLIQKGGPVDQFIEDLEQRLRLVQEDVDWGITFQHAESLARRFARILHPGSHDLMLIAASITFGATWFLSFDKKTRQRSMAAAAGLKVWPPLDREEKGLVHRARRGG
jgi:uncharacterized protein with PIN domain